MSMIAFLHDQSYAASSIEGVIVGITAAFVFEKVERNSSFERLANKMAYILEKGPYIYKKMTMSEYFLSRIRIIYRLIFFDWRSQFPSGPHAELQEPPRLAEFLVGLFVKKRHRNDILGGLAEDFNNDLAAGMSLRRAKRRYWAAALNSIGPQALAALKRIGFVGVVFDYARRWMG